MGKSMCSGLGGSGQMGGGIPSPGIRSPAGRSCRPLPSEDFNQKGLYHLPLLDLLTMRPDR
jgi:hypothetical protein